MIKEAVQIFGVERGDGGRDEWKKKREHKLAIICQCRKQKKCCKSYSSKRQGQHWWSELFVFFLTPFIPNEMCNQSDVVLRKHFNPPTPRHQHPQSHNWFWNTRRQNANLYSFVCTQKTIIMLRNVPQNQQNSHWLHNHTLMSIIPIPTDKVCNWHTASAKNKRPHKKDQINIWNDIIECQTHSRINTKHEGSTSCVN